MPLLETAAGVAKAVESISKTQVGKAKTAALKKKVDEYSLLIQKGLPDYISANYAKCETIKNLLNRNDPIPIDECFEEPKLKIEDRILDSKSYLAEVNNCTHRTIVTGLAGSGKSIFLKHSFRKILEDGHSYYPFFYELRDLNGEEPTKKLLLDSLYESIKAKSESFTKHQFDFGLKNGSFWVILDGFDEISSSLQDTISSQIRDFSQKYHKCPIMVSSRPSNRFLSWEGFHETPLQPFSLEQVVSYLRKLRFDPSKTEQFIRH